MLMHKDQVIREVREDKIQEYLDAGWAQPSKKKKSEKTAETAPEAAQQDLGNDINKGE